MFETLCNSPFAIQPITRAQSQNGPLGQSLNHEEIAHTSVKIPRFNWYPTNESYLNIMVMDSRAVRLRRYMETLSGAEVTD